MPLAVSSALADRSLETQASPSIGGAKRFEDSLTQTLAQPAAVQRTQLTASVASAELRRAWTRVTGEVPDDKTVAVITAQWAHETAHGASMYNYNFGGIKGVGPTGLSVEQRTKEGWGRNERHITDRFRAYESPEAGAEDYVKLLTHRFPEAANAARAGDSEGFVQGLKQRGYFTGDAHAYERSVSSISKELLANSFHDNPGTQLKPVSALPSSAGNATHQVGFPVPRVERRAVDPAAYASMVQPLTPSTLLGALSSSSPTEADFRVSGDKTSITGVSAQSMIDEVLRATLQLASADSSANGRPGDFG